MIAKNGLRGTIRIIPIVMVLLVLLLPSSALAVDERSLEPYAPWLGPDNVFYGVKIFIEDADEAFTFNQSEKLEKQVSHAGERVAEAVRTAEKGDDNATKTAIKLYVDKSRMIMKTAARVNATTGMLEKIQTRMDNQTSVIDSLFRGGKLGDEARAECGYALTNMSAARSTVEQARSRATDRAVCGDGKCSGGENYRSCSQDCPPVCGNNDCETPDETPQNCPQDCPCGDGVCDPNRGENYRSCRADCPPVCGNNDCEAPDENHDNCPEDCKCGNGVCEPDRGENYYSCRGDCLAVCGNGACEKPDEAYSNCPQDCTGSFGAQIVGDVRFDKPSYKAGDKVVAMLDVRNTGELEITSERVVITATVTRLDDWLANKALGAKSKDEKTYTFTMDFNVLIYSGQTETLSAAFNVPKELETSIGKISLAGDYDITLDVSANGNNIGTRNVKLTLGK